MTTTLKFKAERTEYPMGLKWQGSAELWAEQFLCSLALGHAPDMRTSHDHDGIESMDFVLRVLDAQMESVALRVFAYCTIRFGTPTPCSATRTMSEITISTPTPLVLVNLYFSARGVGVRPMRAIDSVTEGDFAPPTDAEVQAATFSALESLLEPVMASGVVCNIAGRMVWPRADEDNEATQ